MTTIIVFFIGAIGSFISFRIGYRLGALSLMTRMNAVVVQMQDVFKDIQEMQQTTQWTEDDL
tara:strand:- start:1288 stop:1473 length:186 start_codon:yes stop_codon:yes gene_type:complete